MLVTYLFTVDIHSRLKKNPSSENVEFKEKSPIEKTETNFDMKFKVFNQF